MKESSKLFVLFFFLCSLMFMGCSPIQKEKHTFSIGDKTFLLDGKPFLIKAAEMHYARIPHQYWRHRLQMMKGMGLNTVATYVFWNLHEPEPGKWDFTGDKNLAEFIKTAGEEGMMVILRPGPYVCAEWEFGGYPWWLQNVKGMEIRRDNPEFLKYTKAYIDRLYKEVGSLQCTKGGPIVMVQCENEFGSYVAQRKDIPLEEHRAYNAKIKQQLADAGFNVPLFTSDGSWLFEGGATPGALPTANGESDIENFLGRLIPEDYPYSHARMLRDYGSTAGNPTGHLKAMLTGNHCHFPVIDGEMVRGGAQEIYFCEFDGPAHRTINVIIQEEK